MQNGNIFKVFGILTFIFQLLMVFTLIIGNRREPIAFDIQVITRISIFFFLTTTTGIGLMYRRKWAAISFSLATLSFAVWLIIGSIWDVPFPWNLNNFFVGAIFLLPVFITVNLWSQLSWNGKDIL
ncbi:MAG: hypothetical protein LC768_00755 [Acidobacteria bacterium]|nr:hypothetical protein [Acidobacteriota bacterium]MCA1636865.1 hypothetical protein [Acidobacteriota bacterium]